MDLFRTTSIRKWPKESMREYLAQKGISIKDSQTHSGATLVSAKLSTLKQYYGIELGERLYLIIRERIEKEDEITKKKMLSSPIMIPTDHFTPPSPSVLSSTPPSSLPSFSLPSSLPPLSLPTLSPSPPHLLVLSDLDLNSGSPPSTHSPTTDIESFNNKNFIRQHPPLLWQLPHLIYYLSLYNIPTGYLKHIDLDVDSFIFMSADSLEELFPALGKKIHHDIRGRFINRNISYIKPAVYCEL